VGLIEGFSSEDVLYSAKQMIDNGLLEAHQISMDGTNVYCINDITPKAHEFLENIRNDSNWNRIKTNAAKIGSSSLSVLMQVAAEVISAKVKSSVGLP
jgi:hypothetical protein